MNQLAASLRYRIIEGPVDLASLQVLEHRVVGWGGRRVTVRILGASHSVTVECDDGMITELLTCAGPDGSGRLLAEAGICADVCVAAHGMVCRAALRPASLALGTSLKGAFAADFTVQVEFPREPGAPAPVTRVGWRVEAHRLAVETIHTYPEEGAAVRSETLFELDGAA